MPHNTEEKLVTWPHYTEFLHKLNLCKVLGKTVKILHSISSWFCILSHSLVVDSWFWYVCFYWAMRQPACSTCFCCPDSSTYKYLGPNTTLSLFTKWSCYSAKVCMTLHLNKWKHSPLTGGTGIISQARVPFSRCTLELFGLFVISQLRYKWPNQTLLVRWKWMGGLYVNIPCLGSKSAVCLWFRQNLLLLVSRTRYLNPPCWSSQTLTNTSYSFSRSSAAASLLRECASTLFLPEICVVSEYL